MPERELLFSVTKKDFDIQTFRGSGAGGQHRNKTDSAVRIVHRESGARGEASERRSQVQNKKEAFRRLIASGKFQAWHKMKCGEALIGKQAIEKAVDAAMRDSLIKTEMFIEGKWIEV